MNKNNFNKYHVSIYAIDLLTQRNEILIHNIKQLDEDTFYNNHDKFIINYKKNPFVLNEKIYATDEEITSNFIKNKILCLTTVIPICILLESLNKDQVIPLKLVVNMEELFKIRRKH